MPRQRRLVVPGYPHHVTQRGARKQRVFFEQSDYESYIRVLAAAQTKANASIWAYCLMPNHVHFIVVPDQQDSLARLFEQPHRLHALRVNKRFGWQGHLWQERFYSCPMEERHLQAAVRYVELNPIRGNLCKSPGDWKWSSAPAHLAGVDDQLVSTAPMLGRFPNWQHYLDAGLTDAELESFRKHSRSGLPLGSEAFITRLERETSRRLRPAKRGRPALSLRE